MPEARGPFKGIRSGRAAQAVQEAFETVDDRLAMFEHDQRLKPAVDRAAETIRRQLREDEEVPPHRELGFREKVRAAASAGKIGHEVWRNRQSLKGKLMSSKFWIVLIANLVLGYLATAGLDPQKCAELIAYLNSAYLGGQSLVDAVRNFRAGEIAMDGWRKREVLKEKLGSRKLIITGLGNGILVTLTATLGLDANASADLVTLMTGTFLGGQSLAGAAKHAKPGKQK